ncbi:MAG TPA: phosphotransferase [Kofleriaceae bacterium]|jgi:hypothetical protein
MLEWVATVMSAQHARTVGRIQRLWGGYGEILRVALDDGRTVIVKRVNPPDIAASVSDTRKRRSYAVEQVFYERYASRCDARCRVATLFAARHESSGWTFVLEDLDAAGFSERCDPATGHALDACLAWLAAFHARFMNDAADGLWGEGTYWHLATRRDELAIAVEREAIDSARAHALDQQLAAARFQTILHGDAKEANFCFTSNERAVAAVDFQYAGRGCGMKDVAYLLHGHSDRHLDTYFRHLRAELSGDADAIEREWRALFPVAQQDFARFLAGWRG